MSRLRVLRAHELLLVGGAPEGSESCYRGIAQAVAAGHLDRLVVDRLSVLLPEFHMGVHHHVVHLHAEPVLFIGDSWGSLAVVQLLAQLGNLLH